MIDSNSKRVGKNTDAKMHKANNKQQQEHTNTQTRQNTQLKSLRAVSEDAFCFSGCHESPDAHCQIEESQKEHEEDRLLSSCHECF